MGICPIYKGKYPSQDIDCILDCNRCKICGKRVMPSWENAMWREESSGKGQRERLQSRVNGEEWHSLKGLTLHQICMDHKHIKGLTLHRICMDHKHIKGLTLHRICMDHEHIKGFTSRQGHLYHFCLLLVHLGPTFANFCYKVSCHVKNGHKSVPSLLWITSNN